MCVYLRAEWTALQQRIISRIHTFLSFSLLSFVVFLRDLLWFFPDVISQGRTLSEGPVLYDKRNLIL